MKVQFFSKNDSYGEKQIYLQVETDFEFNRLNIQSVPYLMRDNQSGLGFSLSYYTNKIDEHEISSQLIREMRELQLKSLNYHIKDYIFKLNFNFYKDKIKQGQTERWIKIPSPWLRPEEAQAFPHGMSIDFQEIKLEELPKPKLALKLNQSFDQEKLQLSYMDCTNLAFEIQAYANLDQVKINIEIEKLSFKISNTNKQFIQGQTYALTWPLDYNLAQTLQDAEASSYRANFPHYVLNFIVEAEEKGQKIQEVQTVFLASPLYIEKVKINRQIAELLQNILNQDFPNHQGEIDLEADWFRFKINNYAFQAGLKDANLCIYVHFSRISYEIDFKQLKKQLSLFNKNLKHKLKEMDNYFVLEAKIKANKLKAPNLSKLIAEVLALAENPELHHFILPYQRI